MIYEEGKGVDRNYSEATYWYEHGAVKGDTDAMFNLGKMIITTGDKDQKAEAALLWIDKSARNGNVEAMYYIGKLYYVASSPDSDDQLYGLHWLRKSCKLGYIPACDDLKIILKK